MGTSFRIIELIIRFITRFWRNHTAPSTYSLNKFKGLNINNNNLVECCHGKTPRARFDELIEPKELFMLLKDIGKKRGLSPSQKLYYDDLIKFYSAKEPTMNNYFEYFKELILMEYYEEQQAFDLFNHTKIVVHVDPNPKIKHVLLYLPFVYKELNVLKHCQVEFKFSYKYDTYYSEVTEIEVNGALVVPADHDLIRLCRRGSPKVRFLCSTYGTQVRLDSLQTITKDPSYFKYLYPEEAPKLFMKRRVLRFFNKKMESNQEQVTAVFNIANNSSNLSPYIIFGPPGTGKTEVLVEAILQAAIPFRKVLVCAPSNSVCDHIARKVAEFKSEVIVRFIAKGYDANPVGVRFTKKACCTEDAIVTCSTLSNAVHLPRSKYDHVFIDEAGQAMECEALTAISKLKQGGQLVLAGDPKQLAPVCLSKLAENFGLNLSLLERLIDSIPIYQKSHGEYMSQYITMLRDNYRCHKQILSLSNRLFYNSMLRAKCPYDPLSEYCLKTSSLTGGDSLIFHAVIGTERRSRGSHSYYNYEEIDQVLEYVKLFLNPSFPVPVVEQEIGVVAPYKGHVLRIQQILHQYGWSKITVGSAETFQGQGRRIIIVSTVRSERDGYKPQLGFVKDQRRFNVMLTRAAAKCIVIGNPFVLRTDLKWDRLINEAKSDKRYINIALKCSKSANRRKKAACLAKSRSQNDNRHG